MRKSRTLAITCIFAISIFLTACGKQLTPTSTATPLPPSPTTRPPTNTPSPTETPTPEPACNLKDVVDRVRTLIPYDEFVVNYNKIIASTNLVVWYVDPEIDPEAEAIDAYDQTVEAADRAIQLGSDLSEQEPCISETFLGFNPIVVDQNYHGWFSANITTSLLPVPESAQTSDDRINAVYPGLVVSYLREEYPEPLASPPSDACSWHEAREMLDGEFLPLSQGNTTFYFVIDDTGVNLWIQLEEPTDPSLLSVILSVTDCLYPKPDNLILFTVNPDGSVTFSGRLPKEGIDTEEFDLFVPWP